MQALPRTVTRGSRLQPRIEGLQAAVAAARGRLPDELLDDVAASVERSTARLRLSAAHTVVAIAGSTGSGKSTIFNALAGAELSASSARRPTTSTAKALLWSDDDADELLTWLGVPERDRHPRASLPAPAPRTRLPEGLVLLDLPDHDSIAAAHHEEAQRIVELADLLIWVVDPQKYADAAIHQRFLQPLAGHRAVTMVVLNHVDTVAEDRRAGMLRDLRKLLVADGIKDPRVLATSARDGIGMEELRTAVRRRVEEKHNAALRVEADVRAAAARLAEASGDGPVAVPDPWVADLHRRVAEAAGLSELVADARRLARSQVARHPVSPPTPPRARPVDRPGVDTAVRALVDGVSRDLTPPWADPVRAAATERLAQTDDRLDADLASLRFDPRPPRWLRLLGPMRTVAAVTALAALILAGAAAGGLAPLPPAVGLLAVAAATAVGTRVGRVAAERAADREAEALADEAGKAVERVLRGQVLAPVRAELACYARFRRGLDAARG
ncbi:GTPase [Nocardioides sp. SYSU DS0651]|uniref:GTPase n=1 Tax=Nocardioides sp. SYSU DS0651 TaxID=3415955 RepID=UPI003F4C2D25